MISLTARTTATALRDDGPALSLFVDTGNADFTNSLDGNGQAGLCRPHRGQSGGDRRQPLLVQHSPARRSATATRADYLLDQLNTMRFNAPVQTGAGLRQVNGTVSDLISQTMNIQGDVVASALTAEESQVTDARGARPAHERGIRRRCR